MIWKVSGPHNAELKIQVRKDDGKDEGWFSKVLGALILGFLLGKVPTLCWACPTCGIDIFWQVYWVGSMTSTFYNWVAHNWPLCKFVINCI